MLHACFVSFVLCFVYTSRYFYTLSATNLLTRCHSASCLFSPVLGFRKPHNEYSRNWTGQKPQFIFFESDTENQRRDRGRNQGGHTQGGCGPTLGRAHRGCGPPRPPPTLTPEPIRSLRPKNPRASRRNPQKPL